LFPTAKFELQIDYEVLRAKIDFRPLFFYKYSQKLASGASVAVVIEKQRLCENNGTKHENRKTNEKKNESESWLRCSAAGIRN
jgi:hypothetical protein